MLHALARLASHPEVESLVRRPPLLYRAMRRALAHADRLGPADRRLAQEKDIAVLLDAACRLPFYARRRCGDGPPRLADFPILGKAEVAQDPAALVRRHLLPSYEAATGGTTGLPLRLTRSLSSIVYEQATIDHVIALAGIDPAGARIAVLRGDSIKHPDDQEPPFWRQKSARQLLMSSHHLRPESFPHYLAALQAFRPEILYCYPSSLEHFLQLAEAAGAKLPLQLAVTSSERPPDDLRGRVRTVTGAPLLDYYGQAERVAFAWSLADGSYLFRPDYGVAEILPRDDGSGLELVGTGLRNRLQPLLRYRTDDLVDLGTDAPTAETVAAVALGLRPFRGIEGRASEFIRTRDGRRIIGLNHIPRMVGGASSIQILQDEPDRIRVVVVPAGDGGVDMERLQANLAAKLPADLSVSIEMRDAPYRLPNGKAPLFVNLLSRPPAA